MALMGAPTDDRFILGTKEGGREICPLNSYSESGIRDTMDLSVILTCLEIQILKNEVPDYEKRYRERG